MQELNQLYEAKYYEKLSNNKVHCFLCPQNCKLQENQEGICKVRKNIQGKLYTTIYHRYSSVNIDPIEKKPLYHFFPGTLILSLGTLGCNLSCNFCQNYSISQSSDVNSTQNLSVEKIVNLSATTQNNIGVAFTYNEPIISIENILEIAEQNKSAGKKNVLVTNGFIEEKPAKELLPLIDAINLDIKSFKESFYRKICKGKLQPILNFAVLTKKYAHLEITNLIIPTLNDSQEEVNELVQWVYKNLGKDTPLHFSRYFPQYESTINPTPVKTLENFLFLAATTLNYVYLGNVANDDFSSTYCPQCKKLLIKRTGYNTEFTTLKNNECLNCGFKIAIVLK